MKIRVLLVGLVAMGVRSSVAKAPATNEDVARGDAWAMAGRCDEAVDYYRRALPSHPAVRARLVHCLLDGKGPKIGADAASEVQRLVDEGLKGAVDGELLLAAGDVALRRNDLAQAAQQYQAAERVASVKHEARRARVEVIARLGESDAEYKRLAIELAHAIAADPAESQASRARADELAAVIEHGPAGRDLVAARRKLADGDAVAAIALLEPRVKAEPTFGAAQYVLGVAYASANRRKDALAAYRHAPDVEEAQVELGIAEFEDGDVEAAGKALRAATTIDPKSQAAYYHLALIDKELGRTSQAREELQRAVSLGADTALGREASTKLQLLTGQVHALAEGQVIDAAQEVALGQAIAEQVSVRFGGADDPVLRPRLEKILRRLAAVADRPERELRYRVQIVDVPVVNAITLPGGTVLVFRGLADLVKKDLGDSDDAWAAILGHECAHAALRHGVGMMRMASSLTGANAFEGGVADLTALMNTISRAHEFEADQFGALYAYRAGFSPSVALRLHDAMLKSSGEIPRGMTHPTHAERLAGLRDYLVELRGKVHGFDLATKALADGDLDLAIVRLEVFLGVFPDSLSARSNLGVALHRKAMLGLAPTAELRRVTDVDPESHARKVELRSTGATEAPKLDRRMLESAVVEYKSALAVDPSYAPALTNLGAALYDLGDEKAARLALDKAIARAPRAPETWINHATINEAEHKPLDAQTDLRRAIEIDPKSAVAWFDLALVNEKLGRTADAKAAWDAYLAIDGKGAWADLARQRRQKLN